MEFKLIDSGWAAILDQAAKEKGNSIKLICPFIKLGPITRLLKLAKPGSIEIITRFNLADFFEGVSDTQALQALLRRGASIKGIRNLHTKLYIFGEERVVLTSANLTEMGLNRNHEFGFVSDAPEIVARCLTYFSHLWQKGGSELTPDRITSWENRLEVVRKGGGRPKMSLGLGDEGTDVGYAEAAKISIFPRIQLAGDAFVKFLGLSNKRSPLSASVLEVVKQDGCHWACHFGGGRPRQIKDGDVIYFASMVADPNDMRIFGRAIAMQHKPGRDDATESDIKLLSFLNERSHFVRVHHTEFLAGALTNGISLGELMDELKANAFMTTQQNAAKGIGNTNPRNAYNQKQSVHLSGESHAWLCSKLEEAFVTHGRLAENELEQLDWPDSQTVYQDGLSNFGRMALLVPMDDVTKLSVLQKHLLTNNTVVWRCKGNRTVEYLKAISSDINAYFFHRNQIVGKARLHEVHSYVGLNQVKDAVPVEFIGDQSAYSLYLRFSAVEQVLGPHISAFRKWNDKGKNFNRGIQGPFLLATEIDGQPSFPTTEPIPPSIGESN